MLSRAARSKSPKLESGTEFSAAETGRRNGLIRLDCRNRDRANQAIWQTCLCECGAIASVSYSVQLQSVGGGGAGERTCDPLLTVHRMCLKVRSRKEVPAAGSPSM